MKIGLIGCGGWGTNIAKTLAKLNALAIIADPSSRAQALASELGVGHVADAEVLITDPSIGALAIATPAETHFALAAKAIAAGKDVFVEKPITLDLNEATELSALAQKAGRILMIGHLLQYHSAFVRAKEIAASGKIGRVRHVQSYRHNLGKLRMEEDVLWSFAPHDISMVLALIAERPEKVRCFSSHVLGTPRADITALEIAFADGRTAAISSSWLSPLKEQRLVIVGDAGMLTFDDRKPWAEKLELQRYRIEETANGAALLGETPEALATDPSEPLADEMTHFIDSVAQRREPVTGANEAIPVLEVLMAASRSMASSGDWIEMSSVEPSYFVHPTALVDKGVSIGDGTRIWHFSHVLGGSTIGQNCVIGQNVMIGPDAQIGSGCKIQNNVAVYKGVTLEDDVFCGPSMVFTNVLTPRAHVERKDEFAPTHVERGATLGANCTIVCGNRVGAYAMVGAGAVVTRDVPSHALVVGNPARQIGWVSEAGERLGDDLVCARTGTAYRIESGSLVRTK